MRTQKRRGAPGSFRNIRHSGAVAPNGTRKGPFFSCIIGTAVLVFTSSISDTEKTSTPRYFTHDAITTPVASAFSFVISIP